MYIYIDESGDLNLENAQVQPFFILTALVIKDKSSKRAIAQAVTRATIALKKKGKLNSENWVKELKGRELRAFPDIRIALLSRMVRKANFEVYCSSSISAVCGKVSEETTCIVTRFAQLI